MNISIGLFEEAEMDFKHLSIDGQVARAIDRSNVIMELCHILFNMRLGRHIKFGDEVAEAT